MCTRESHPLLRPDLLSIKNPLEKGEIEISPQEGTLDKTVDAFGSLYGQPNALIYFPADLIS
jgi:hypothetical protein